MPLPPPPLLHLLLLLPDDSSMQLVNQHEYGRVVHNLATIHTMPSAAPVATQSPSELQLRIMETLR